MKILLNLVTTILFAASSLMTAQTAIAGHWDYFSGSGCDANSDAYFSKGRVFNQSYSSARSLECPVVSWNPMLGSKYSQIWGSIRVIDTHYFENVRCEASVQYNNRSGVFRGFRTRSSSDSSTTPQLLDFGRMNVYGISRDEALHYVRCDVPARYLGRMSGIVQYKLYNYD